MKHTLVLLFAIISNIAFAQGGALADLKFEEAEIAFNNKDYGTTIAKLNEFDKMYGSVTSKSLYLNIVSQYQLFDQLYNVSIIGAQLKNTENGITIAEILPNTPANTVGLLKNDIITKFNEIKVSETSYLIGLIKYTSANNVIKLQIIREGTILEKNVTVVMNNEIRDENKIYYDDTNFDKLVSLKKMVNSYLNAMDKEVIDDKFREIYNIKTKLEVLPSSKSSWLAAKQNAEFEKQKEIEKEKQLREKHKVLAKKIDSWDWNEKIKIGANYDVVKKELPLILKNFKKHVSDNNNIYYHNSKVKENELYTIRVSTSDQIEEYRIFRGIKNTKGNDVEINKAKEELRQIFGNDIIFVENPINNLLKIYYIDCPFSLNGIGIICQFYNNDSIQIQIFKEKKK